LKRRCKNVDGAFNRKEATQKEKQALASAKPRNKANAEPRKKDERETHS
jgi:hypothetical protein